MDFVYCVHSCVNLSDTKKELIRKKENVVYRIICREHSLPYLYIYTLLLVLYNYFACNMTIYSDEAVHAEAADLVYVN